MVYLVDTNVLLPFVNPSDSRHQIVQSAARKLWADSDELKTTLQNLAEFWNVCTRPRNQRNGLNLPTSQTNQLLQTAEQVFPLLPDTPSVYHEWRQLVVSYGVSGVQVHDARLVAVMLAHGVKHILTFDAKFSRYLHEGIVVVDPAHV